MTTLDPEIFDDLFHGCAWVAFLEQVALQQGTPCPEQTRRRAYRLYEKALTEKEAVRSEMD